MTFFLFLLSNTFVTEIGCVRCFSSHLSSLSIYDHQRLVTLYLFQNSHQRSSIKKAFPKSFAIFTGKQLYWSLFLIKVRQDSNFIKYRLQHRFFPVNIVKFLSLVLTGVLSVFYRYFLI